MRLGIKRNDAYLIKRLEDLALDNSDVSLFYEENYKIEMIDTLITTNITERELDDAKNLKTIIIPFTGINNLPLQLIKERNITLVNSHAHSPVVALRAFTLALALLGRVVELHKQLERGNWKGIDGTNQWESIIDKRIGLIGMGGIGNNIVNYLKPLTKQFITLNRYQKRIENLSEFTFYETIEAVCLNSDIIFISLPLTVSTKGIIDENILVKMKDKYIVNVGRGELIEEKALFDALNNNTLKGAALDVWYQYPKQNSITEPSKYPIHKLSNVVISPHCAGITTNSQKLVVEEIINNLKYYLKENNFKNTVDLDRSY